MDDRDISSLTDELWIKTKLSTVTALFVETEELSAVADEKVFNTRDLFYRTFNDQVFKHGKKQMLRWTNKNVWLISTTLHLLTSTSTITTTQLPAPTSICSDP